MVDTITRVLSAFGLLMFAIIGAYIGFKGPMFGELAAVNRRKGVGYCIFGIGLLVTGVIVNVVANLIGTITGLFAMMFLGILGVGAASVMVGLTAILTGRDIAAQSALPETAAPRDDNGE